MNLSKLGEWFRPDMVTERINIIGCGSVGSTVAELLARFGLTKISLWDMDTVESKNLANQMFNNKDVGKNKAEATARHIWEINPECADDLRVYKNGWNGEKLSGYVFLCVDNIELRRKIVEQHLKEDCIKGMFDFRTRLLDAQHYACDWSDEHNKECFLRSMEFTHAEAAEETPVSACGVTLGVAPTVRMICTAGVGNFVNFVREQKLKKMILINAFTFEMDAI